MCHLPVGNSSGCLKIARVPSKRADPVPIQGRHECEVVDPSNEAEESVAAWEDCQKNHGHAQFIPAWKFRLGHLPEWCRKTRVLRFVRTVCAITVRLRVHYTSPARPDGYAFSGHRGSDKLHLGSGYVGAVLNAPGPCTCDSCRETDAPRRQCYHIYLSTACHVIFSTEEARATRVDFFYDSADSGGGGGGGAAKMKSVWAADVVARDQQDDWCMVRCVSHDHILANELRDVVEDMAHKPTPTTNYHGRNMPTMCVVVSHPHGMPKQVTVGNLAGQATLGTYSTRFKYNTATCPGSSGGPVFVAIAKKSGCAEWMGPHSQKLHDFSTPVNLSGSCVRLSDHICPKRKGR
ncbi:hypothetical protein EGW08_022095 [Elysia chlorotica]|uniref:Peptidase S1 domain-containing protein n=1 Tax=Elysia chlorotica TaxID=188477 RepID=A0A3S0ZA07_ELYCH|nr:hypothetical protein EGW08_022095 [Elysia chlorotica]